MLILGLGLGLECFGLGINNNAKRHIIWIMQYWIIVNVHWIPTLELPSSCHKRPGLLAYLFYCSRYWLEIERLDQLWHWLEKFTLAFSTLALVCGLDLGFACLWPWPWSVALTLVLHVSDLGLGLLSTLALTPLALLTSLPTGILFHAFRSDLIFTNILEDHPQHG